MDPTYPVFPIFAFFGFLLTIVPLYWQFEAWNVGIIWYIFWTALYCISQYFNSVVWAGNVVNSAPAWCEISMRIIMGASVGIPAASLCINRRLYCIASVPPVAIVSKADKRRDIIIDSFICGLVPAFYIALQIGVQRHRFDILEDVGCSAALFNSLPTYFVSSAPPLVLSFASAVYLSFSQTAFAAARATLGDDFAGHKNLTPTRFLRLSGLAFSVLLITVPLGLLTLATTATAVLLSNQVSRTCRPSISTSSRRSRVICGRRTRPIVSPWN
ncbi:GPCR fungal pheromone mating factor [Mycena rosella]|uniref:GPCR fungal pheromone mating factor n=1 Tax=Mycena rosella TaxID=1033263 RepID=A0AAD7D4I1_MYCRO|nr:GPCR fungal pheromone mating factor [Mycena rosella]